MDSALEPVFAQVLRRNPGEVEFHQAVREVFDSLGPVIKKNPQYAEAAVRPRAVAQRSSVPSTAVPRAAHTVPVNPDADRHD